MMNQDGSDKLPNLIMDKAYGKLSELMQCEAFGGFRVCGSKKKFHQKEYLDENNHPSLKYVVLYSTGEDSNWLNEIDLETGRVS